MGQVVREHINEGLQPLKHQWAIIPGLFNALKNELKKENMSVVSAKKLLDYYKTPECYYVLLHMIRKPEYDSREMSFYSLYRFSPESGLKFMYAKMDSDSIMKKIAKAKKENNVSFLYEGLQPLRSQLGRFIDIAKIYGFREIPKDQWESSFMFEEGGLALLKRWRGERLMLYRTQKEAAGVTTLLPDSYFTEVKVMYYRYEAWRSKARQLISSINSIDEIEKDFQSISAWFDRFYPPRK